MSDGANDGAVGPDPAFGLAAPGPGYNGKHRSFVFTKNNYTEEEWEHIKHFLGNDTAVKYAIIGREVGDAGTPHIQGYVQFRNSRAYKSILLALGGHVWLHGAKGSALQNYKYCSKQDDFVEFGKRPSERGEKRQRLDDMAESLVGGEPLAKLARQDPATFARYHHGLRALAAITEPRRTDLRS